MASSPDNLSMALFCDFENVALGVRDAQYDKFDIKPVLERLLLKGSIVVKKAYCDWDRYKGFKSKMHEANFELIEIPHVRQSGKNSADIRLVVDALDLCYTKSHVNTFVIISGDSDFSPLVSKLRENAKTVIGVGVKQSTSDLLIANCDEFIFYDDLVREIQRAADQRAAHSAQRRKPGEDKPRKKDDIEVRRTQAVELAAETFDALMAERGDSGKIWASVLKEAIKRRRPDFSESYYGFRAFGNLLEEAQARGLMSFGRDEKSGAYVYRSTSSLPSDHEHLAQSADSLDDDSAHDAAAPAGQNGPAPRRESTSRRDAPEGRRRGRQSRSAAQRAQVDVPQEPLSEPLPSAAFVVPTQSRPAFDPDAPENTGHSAVDPYAPENTGHSAVDPYAPEHTGDAAPAADDGNAPGATDAQASGSDDAQTVSRTKRATRAGRTTRKPRVPASSKATEAGADAAADTPVAESDASAPAGSAATADTPEVTSSDSAEPPRKAARKTVSRARRPRKTPAASDAE